MHNVLVSRRANIVMRITRRTNHSLGDMGTFYILLISDELIRQVTINCAERGLLLLRVRDEIRMTIAAYQTLYESSIAFGMRKALMAEQRKADLEAKIKQLQLENDDLHKQVSSLTQKCVAIEARETDRRQAEEQKHQEQVSYLKKANAQLKQNLENLLSIPKS